MFVVCFNHSKQMIVLLAKKSKFVVQPTIYFWLLFDKNFIIFAGGFYCLILFALKKKP